MGVSRPPRPTSSSSGTSRSRRSTGLQARRAPVMARSSSLPARRESGRRALRVASATTCRRRTSLFGERATRSRHRDRWRRSSKSPSTPLDTRASTRGARPTRLRRAPRLLGRDPFVAVEDAHWADEATLDVLRLLGRRSTNVGVSSSSPTVTTSSRGIIRFGSRSATSPRRPSTACRPTADPDGVARLAGDYDVDATASSPQPPGIHSRHGAPRAGSTRCPTPCATSSSRA